MSVGGKGIKCQMIIEALEQYAPRYLAEEWDNVGLLVGSPSAVVTKALVCLDVTKAVVERAVAERAELIVAHHPLIFKPLKNLRADNYAGALLRELLQADIAVYAAHTNLDTADGGVNDVLAGLLELRRTEPLAVSHTEQLYKLVVYIPDGYVEAVAQAVFEAGAGQTGAYGDCCFQVGGYGQFKPLAGSAPFIGTVGQTSRVAETRWETIMPASASRRVVRAMLRAHPYEEAAYDLLPLQNDGRRRGLGRIGELPEALNAGELALKIKQRLSVDHVRLVGDAAAVVRKVALCTGSGAEFINKAAFAGADVYVTGDVKYHEAQKALELGLVLIDAGHFGTEMPVVPVLAEYLAKWAARQRHSLTVLVDDFSKDVFTVY